ncbi:MAG: hypothetical protein RIT45_250 [Pseudomonadota bacterium]|jgi:3-methyl-2-oxobutanoate hydroxymethyltransferase
MHHEDRPAGGIAMLATAPHDSTPSPEGAHTSTQNAAAPPQPLTPTVVPSEGDGGIALYGAQPRSQVRVHHLRTMKAKGTKITAVTCYDATFARLVDSAGVDVVLVGDSLGNVVQGQTSTLPVQLDHIVYHSAAVARGLARAHLVADLPFMTYYSAEVALPNAARLLAEGGAHAVKLEGGAEVAPIVARLVQAGVPVMGHIGLTPQSVHAMGGHRVQGRGAEARARLRADALALQEAGCYAIVLEGIPTRLAADISAELTIPTIGIGAGEGCDGQILVLYDMLGLNPDFQPKFLKRFAELGAEVHSALRAYGDEVRAGTFPAPEHGYSDPSEREPPLKVAR